MDLRVLVLIADDQLADLVRAQVENLGCRCTVVETFEAASGALTWAEAAVVDLAGSGLDDLNRLRVEAPTLRTLAIAPDGAGARGARTTGADQILTEPFSVAELIDSVRALGRNLGSEVVDLVTGQRKAAPAVEDAPWFSTR